ncbi:MAG TPA: hypothetical protein VHN99_09445, partial [Deinococcales bacterium]|nr:hypothetical protein [Deinococcales bacterium]
MLLALCLFFLPGSAWAQLALSGQAPRDASPGGLEGLVFTLSNGGSTQLDVSFSVEAPAGLSVLIPPDAVSLPAGQAALVAVTLNLDALLPAGSYSVTLRAVASGGQSASTSAVLNVQAAPGLKLTGPASTLPGPFTVSVTNTGNGPDSVLVTARAPAGGAVSPAGFETFRLGAGESRGLTFTASIPRPDSISILATGTSGARSTFTVRALPDASLPPPPFSLHGKLTASYPSPFGVGLSLAGPISDFASLAVNAGWSDGTPFGTLGVTAGDFTVEAGLLSTPAPVTGASLVGLGGHVTWAPLPWTFDLAGTAGSVVATAGYQSSANRLGASVGYSDRGWSARASGGLNGNPNVSASLAWAQPDSFNWTVSSQYSLDAPGLVAVLGLPPASVTSASLDGEATGGMGSFSVRASAFAIAGWGSLKLEDRFSALSDGLVDLATATAQVGPYTGGLAAGFGPGGLNLTVNAGAGFPIAPNVTLSGSGSASLTSPDFWSGASLAATLSGLLFDRLTGSLSGTLGGKQSSLTASLNYGGPVTVGASGGVTWQAGLPSYQAGASLAYTDGTSSLAASGNAVWTGASTQLAFKASGSVGFDLPVPDALTGLAGGRNLGVVTGIVYRDDNANGTRDPGEPGLAGATVRSGDYSARVAADGSFRLFLPAGAVSLGVGAPDLDVIPPAEVKFTLAKDEARSVAIPAVPGATVRLRVAVDPSPNPPSPEGAGVVLTSATGAFA